MKFWASSDSYRPATAATNFARRLVVPFLNAALAGSNMRCNPDGLDYARHHLRRVSEFARRRLRVCPDNGHQALGHNIRVPFSTCRCH